MCGLACVVEASLSARAGAGDKLDGSREVGHEC